MDELRHLKGNNDRFDALEAKLQQTPKKQMPERGRVGNPGSLPTWSQIVTGGTQTSQARVETAPRRYGGHRAGNNGGAPETDQIGDLRHKSAVPTPEEQRKGLWDCGK